MKLSSRIAKLKQQKPMKQTKPRAAPEKSVRVARHHWVLLGICLILAVGGTGAVLYWFVWNKVPAELVGRWEVAGGPMQGGTFEFYRNGTLDVKTNKPGTEDLTIHGRVSLQGKTLLTTTRSPDGRREDTSQSIIRELTPDSLVLELERGDVLKLVRKR